MAAWAAKGGGADFFRVSCGFFVGKIDGEEVKQYAYTGHLKGIRRFEDEYKGEKSNKIEIILTDEEETIKIQFTEEAWYTVGFLQRIGQVDLAKKITLGVMASKQNEKMSFCWMKQGDTKINKDERTPRPKKIKAGTKMVDDWTDVVNLMTEETDRINTWLTGEAKGSGMPLDVPPPANEGADDDLPF